MTHFAQRRPQIPVRHRLSPVFRHVFCSLVSVLFVVVDLEIRSFLRVLRALAFAFSALILSTLFESHS